MFPFTLPCFAPTAVPQVLAFRFRFLHFPFRFRFLSSASASLPATGPSVSSFPFYPFLPHSGFFGARLPLSLLTFPRSFQPDFSCFLSRFSYSDFCWFPFVLPCFAPAAVPQVIPFQISPPGPMLDFSLSFVRFRFSISLLSLCFFLSFLRPFLPHSGFSGGPFRSRFLGFPRSFRPGLPCFLSRFLYSASCLFPFVLPCFAPTAVPQVLAFCFRFRPFPFPAGFFRPLAVPVLTTQPSVLLFPFFLFPPLRGFLSAPLSLSFLRLFPVQSCLISHAFLPGSGTQLSVCFLSPFPDSLPTAVPQVLTLCFRFRYFPLSFRFLSSPSVSPPATQPLFLPFPSSSFRLTVASAMLRFFLSASPFSTLSSAWFSMLLFRFSVLGFLFVSFHPSRFRSHSCSTGASLLFHILPFASLPGFRLTFRFLSSPSVCL